MIQYECFLTLTIRHPLIDASQWVLLPCSNTEQYLMRNRLRMSFNQGRLSILGISKEYVKKSKKKVEIEEMCFYLFCKDTYFQRASELPLFAPGREFLFISVYPKKEGSAQFVDVVPAKPWIINDINIVRKRHIGKPYGIPPSGLLHLPRIAIGTNYNLTWDIATRKIYWAYLITPLPSNPEFVSIKGGLEPFIPKILNNGLLFISKKPISLTAFGYKGISLVLGEYGIILMENLASPDISEIQWDASVNNYRGTVLLDLHQYGVML